MAEFGKLETLTLQAAADLSLFQYKAIRGAGAASCNVASNAADSDMIGILINKPASGEFASVAYSGMSKACAGAAVTVYDQLTVNGSGRVITVTSGSMCLGQALEAAGADGDIITVLLSKPVRWAGAP